MGERAARHYPDRGGRAQGLEAATLGEESWAAAGGRGSGRAGALAHLLVPREGPGMGGGSVRTPLRAGITALGAVSAAPGARSLHPTGAAAVSAPRLSSGSGAPQEARARAGGGVGGGPRLGSAWGLGPRAGSAPERRASGSARGAPPAERENTSAPAGEHTPTLARRRPVTNSRPRGHGQTHVDTGIRWGTPTPTCGFATESHPRRHGPAHTDKHWPKYTHTSPLIRGPYTRHLPPRKRMYTDIHTLIHTDTHTEANTPAH